MYRQPDTTPHCTSCGATELTPATYFTNSEGYPRIYFHVRGGEPGFLGTRPSVEVDVNRARVCLACGQVMLGLGPELLAELRAKASSLVPYQS